MDKLKHSSIDYFQIALMLEQITDERLRVALTNTMIAELSPIINTDDSFNILIGVKESNLKRVLEYALALWECNVLSSTNDCLEMAYIAWNNRYPKSQINKNDLIDLATRTNYPNASEPFWDRRKTL